MDYVLDALLDPMKNPIVFAVPFFVLSLLIEIAAYRFLETDPEARGYADRRDTLASLTMGLGSVFFLTLFKVLTLVVFVAISVHLAPWHLPTDTWWYWLVLILAVDLAYYANHRFVHRVRIGWAAHQAHHSSEYFNFSTALRQKWNPWTEFFFWLPLPLLGFEPWTLYVAFSINLIYQFFVHTERVGRLPRPVEYVFNTPSHHRVHHGSDVLYLDRNYGGILIVWDRLFGSFQPEVHRPTYGLLKEVDTYNPIRLEYGEYAQMVADVRSTDRWRHKLAYVFAPPGWKPPEAAQDPERGALR